MRTAGRCDGGSVQRSDPLPQLQNSLETGDILEHSKGCMVTRNASVNSISVSKKRTKHPHGVDGFFSVSKWRTKHDAAHLCSDLKESQTPARKGRWSFSVSKSFSYRRDFVSNVAVSHPFGAVGGRFVSRRNEASYLIRGSYEASYSDTGTCLTCFWTRRYR